MDPMRCDARGFSLVELMLAIFTSMLIVAGLFYAFLGDLRSYESARSSQGLVSKSRMVTQTIRLYIQQAGFRDIDALKSGLVYGEETSNTGWVWEEGQILQGSTTSASITDGKTDSDILALRFAGAAQSGIVSCDGTNLLSDDVNELTLYVNSSNQLMCKFNNDTALQLDENVEFMELLYGSADQPNRYYSASNVTDWGAINRIKVGLLLSHRLEHNQLINNNSFTIFNKSISASEDNSYRAVTVETVILGNQEG